MVQSIECKSVESLKNKLIMKKNWDTFYIDASKNETVIRTYRGFKQIGEFIYVGKKVSITRNFAEFMDDDIYNMPYMYIKQWNNDTLIFSQVPGFLYHIEKSSQALRVGLIKPDPVPTINMMKIMRDQLLLTGLKKEECEESFKKIYDELTKGFFAKQSEKAVERMIGDIFKPPRL